MSYEGYVEHLCAKGHYFTIEAYENGDNLCPICDGHSVWENSVDETNGKDPKYPWTLPYPLRLAGHEVEEKKDYFGNRYYDRIPVYFIPKKNKDKTTFNLLEGKEIPLPINVDFHSDGVVIVYQSNKEGEATTFGQSCNLKDALFNYCYERDNEDCCNF